MANFTVPVIDISPYVNDGKADQRSLVAEAIDNANATVGFLQVVGHGIASETITDLIAAMDAFFSLPSSTKLATRGPSEINRGYAPPRSESLSLSLGIEPEGNTYDLFEAFNTGSTASQFPHLSLSPAHYPENLWPGGLEQFQQSVEAYFSEAGRVARMLVQIFADALQLPSDFFAAYTDHSIDVLRLNNYAGKIDAFVEGAKGMGEHTDYGIVTVLWADQVPGLQVLGADHAWHDVIPEDGALLVNLGDLTARWTNDRWKSTLHRVMPPVVNGRLTHRRSAAFFHDGNVDAVIETLSSCRDESGDSYYAPTTVGAHLAEKLGGSRIGRANVNATREALRVQAAT